MTLSATRSQVEQVRERLNKIVLDDVKKAREIERLRRAGRVLTGYLLILSEGRTATPKQIKQIEAAIAEFGRGEFGP